MAFEVFRPRRFQPQALKTIEQANAIISEYQSQGFVLTLRQLHYQFVARDLYENSHKNYKALGVTLLLARDAGLSDWDAIEDRTRDLQTLSTWASPTEIVAAAARTYREDLWDDQGHRVEVWIEKDAPIGVIENICREYRVPFTATRGNISQIEIYKAGKRFSSYIDDGITPVILHLADHDPTGIDMTRDVADRLSLYAKAPIEVRRIALNMDQVKLHRPPPNPVKENDVRTAAYRAAFNTSTCWELDALSPAVLSDLIKTEIESLIDPKPWKAAKAKEAQSRRQLAAVGDGMA